MARRNLNRDEIVETAIALLSEEGLDAFSMRKLATRLKVQAPTLYYHIPDKSALLNEVLIRLFEDCFARMPQCLTWPNWMRAFGAAIWEVQQSARFAPMLILTAQLDDAHFNRSVERVGREMAMFDADQDHLLFVQSAVQAVITGWSTFAHSAYSEKMERFIDFRQAAMDSVDALVSNWETKIGA